MSFSIRQCLESERVLHKFWLISLHQTLEDFQMASVSCLHADYAVYLSILKDVFCRC